MIRDELKLDEYNQSAKENYIAFREKNRILKMCLTLSNNPYKIGDVIEDNIGSIKISDSGCWIGRESEPVRVYSGKCLITGAYREIEQCNVRTHKSLLLKGSICAYLN